MRASIIQIGNSRGIRIPKSILEQCGFKKDVELEVAGGALVIKPCKTRYGWDDAFKKMAECGDDRLINLPNSEWDFKEWEW